MDQPEDRAGLAEDWAVLESFLPANWRELAASTGALKDSRKDKSAEHSVMFLNKRLVNEGPEIRDEQAIEVRAKWLHARAVEVWPHADDFDPVSLPA